MEKVFRIVKVVIMPMLRKKLPVNSTATWRRKCWAKPKTAQPIMAQMNGTMRFGSWNSGSRPVDFLVREILRVSLSARGPPMT